MKNLKKIIYEYLYHQVDEKLIYHQQVDEKLVITKDTKEKQISDEELEKDYQAVWGSTTKAEKKLIGDKYGCTDYRMKPIMQVILDKFRENRFNKKEFTKEDIKHFWRYDMGDSYDKLKPYLKQEPEAFIVYMYNIYHEKCKPILNTYYRSYADKRLIKIKDNLKKYLDENRISY